MGEINTIFNAIGEIGFTPVVIILILLFHFRTVRNLEKRNERLFARNERLLETIIDLTVKGENFDS